MRHVYTATFLASLFATGTCWAQDKQEPDNGTDPTRISTQAAAAVEHLSFVSDATQSTFKATFVTPVSADKRTGFRMQVPVVHNDVLGNDCVGIGDVGIRFNRVAKITREYGFVLGGEMLFDTASRVEYGTGQNVFKGSAIYAKFLPSGAIFAPALVHSVSVWGDDARADVNNTVIDFYYVPKLSNPRMLLTIDPALNSNWETDSQFLSLAVTGGYVLGPAFGGNSQIYLKPSLAAGNERPFDWSIELGYKVIGF